MPAYLLQLGDDLIARHLALQDKEGDAVVAALLGRLAGTDQEVGPHAVRDERLRAVDQVAAVDLARGRPQRRDVGAGAGLGDPERADQLSPDSRDEPALLLFLAPELPDRRHRDLGVRAEPRGDPPAAPPAPDLPP